MPQDLPFARPGSLPPLSASHPPRLSRRQWLLLVIILTYGTGLRGWHLDRSALLTDEAETSINALTILQRGVPRDEYLGLPIFENTLGKPWPESHEYEFRDTSYSDKGLAIYHGWLPLYAVAASLALHGIKPDDDPTRLAPRYSEKEMRWRIRAARTPAVLFAAVFLVAMFFAARELFGNDAGWAALAAATVSTSAITLARQARYYSLTVALTALCCLLVCLAVKRGRWRDVWLAGVLFVLLFHTNLLAFATVCAVSALAVPFLTMHERIGPKVAALAATIAVGTIPWMLLSGFFAEAADRPTARSLLSFQEFLRYPLERWPYVLLAAATTVFILAGPRLRGTIPERIREPFNANRLPFFVTLVWAVLGFLIFVALVPAASYFFMRLTLVIFVPSLLFGAMLFASVGRAMVRRNSSPLGAVCFVLVLAAAGKATLWAPRLGDENREFFALISHLRELHLRPGTRLYTQASENLALKFYTAMPFQNVMPVRKAFLDNYEGDLLILESIWFSGLQKSDVEAFLASRGQTAGPDQIKKLQDDAYWYLQREDLGSRVAEIFPPADPLSDAVRPLLPYQLDKTAEASRLNASRSGNPIFNGYDVDNHRRLWEVFFFRFVGVEWRTGRHLNYANRIQTAKAVILPTGWVLIHCQGPHV
jgi:hypothetical protein